MNKSTNGTAAARKPKSAQFIHNDVGEEIGVFLDMKTYRRLLKDLEDAYDARLIQETMGDERIPWKDLKRELQSEGKI